MEVTTQQAQQYYVTHPNHSFAMFCISEAGDLFVNGDYGQSNFAWRSFNSRDGKTLKSFKEFLCSIEEGYWKGKMEHNMNFMEIKKGRVRAFVDNTWPLFKLLQEHLKSELKETV